MNQQPDEFDREVRRYVYDVAMQCGYPPLLAESSDHFRVSSADVRAAFRRLAAGRVLVLQPDTDEILMASPFSAVPTPFVVEVASHACFGNCIWDALGIAAMMGQDARVQTACADCGTAMEVRVAGGAPHYGEALAHFAIPARHWWDDIVFN
jgi:hypothetical protein